MIGLLWQVAVMRLRPRTPTCLHGWRTPWQPSIVQLGNFNDMRFHTAYPRDFVKLSHSKEMEEHEHDTHVSSYLRLVIHNPAFGILFVGELIDNVCR